MRYSIKEGMKMQGFLKQTAKILVGKRLKKAAWPLAGLGLFFLAGFWLVFSSWDGKVYLSLSAPSNGGGFSRAPGEGGGATGRFLAGKGETAPVRAFSKEDLSDQSSLFAGGKILDRKNGFIRFYLGNFIAPGGYEGKRRFICQVYDSAELVWTGLDADVSGNSGGMIFRAPCQTAPGNEEFIGPFHFPAGKILSAPHQTVFDLKKEGLPDSKKSGLIKERSLVRFYNMTPAMNNHWLLVRARFFNFSNEADEEDRGEEDGFFVSFKTGGPSFELSFQPPAAADPASAKTPIAEKSPAGDSRVADARTADARTADANAADGAAEKSPAESARTAKKTPSGGASVADARAASANAARGTGALQK